MRRLLGTIVLSGLIANSLSANPLLDVVYCKDNKKNKHYTFEIRKDDWKMFNVDKNLFKMKENKFYRYLNIEETKVKKIGKGNYILGAKLKNGETQDDFMINGDSISKRIKNEMKPLKNISCNEINIVEEDYKFEKKLFKEKDFLNPKKHIEMEVEGYTLDEIKKGFQNVYMSWEIKEKEIDKSLIKMIPTIEENPYVIYKKDTTNILEIKRFIKTLNNDKYINDRKRTIKSFINRIVRNNIKTEINQNDIKELADSLLPEKFKNNPNYKFILTEEDKIILISQGRLNKRDINGKITIDFFDKYISKGHNLNQLFRLKSIMEKELIVKIFSKENPYNLDENQKRKFYENSFKQYILNDKSDLEFLGNIGLLKSKEGKKLLLNTRLDKTKQHLWLKNTKKLKDYFTDVEAFTFFSNNPSFLKYVNKNNNYDYYFGHDFKMKSNKSKYKKYKKMKIAAEIESWKKEIESKISENILLTKLFKDSPYFRKNHLELYKLDKNIYKELLGDGKKFSVMKMNISDAEEVVRNYPENIKYIKDIHWLAKKSPIIKKYLNDKEGKKQDKKVAKLENSINSGKYVYPRANKKTIEVWKKLDYKTIAKAYIGSHSRNYRDWKKSFQCTLYRGCLNKKKLDIAVKELIINNKTIKVDFKNIDWNNWDVETVKALYERDKDLFKYSRNKRFFTKVFEYAAQIDSNTIVDLKVLQGKKIDGKYIKRDDWLFRGWDKWLGYVNNKDLYKTIKDLKEKNKVPFKDEYIRKLLSKDIRLVEFISNKTFDDQRKIVYGNDMSLIRFVDNLNEDVAIDALRKDVSVYKYIKNPSEKVQRTYKRLNR